MKKIAIFFSCIICLYACKKTSTTTTPAPTPQLYSYSIKASVTTTGINGYDDPHQVYLDTRVTSKNKLLIFLPGTSATAANYSLIGTAAAGMGYHTINLMYPNGSELYTLSLFSTDLSIMGKCRQEAFDGTDQIAGLTIDANNCIKNRLVKLLSYLQVQYPTQNWNQYLNGATDVQWSKVVLAGHSQGGGHAFYIAKKVAVDRTVAFASIDYNTTVSQNATWVTQAGATDISKYYSFNHTGDEVFAYANVQIQLGAMGITGPAINTELVNSPYANSHTLTTTATPAIATFGNHSVICLDSYITKDANGKVKPTIVSAWEYLLGK